MGADNYMIECEDADEITGTLRRVFKNAENLGLSREFVQQMSRMMNAARRRLMHERWEVMDTILTRLAAAMPEPEAYATVTIRKEVLP